MSLDLVSLQSCFCLSPGTARDEDVDWLRIPENVHDNAVAPVHDLRLVHGLHLAQLQVLTLDVEKNCVSLEVMPLLPSAVTVVVSLIHSNRFPVSLTSALAETVPFAVVVSFVSM